VHQVVISGVNGVVRLLFSEPSHAENPLESAPFGLQRLDRADRPTHRPPPPQGRRPGRYHQAGAAVPVGTRAARQSLAEHRTWVLLSGVDEAAGRHGGPRPDAARLPPGGAAEGGRVSQRLGPGLVARATSGPA